jgi:hypothetical protein
MISFPHRWLCSVQHGVQLCGSGPRALLRERAAEVGNLYMHIQQANHTCTTDIYELFSTQGFCASSVGSSFAAHGAPSSATSSRPVFGFIHRSSRPCLSWPLIAAGACRFVYTRSPRMRSSATCGWRYIRPVSRRPRGRKRHARKSPSSSRRSACRWAASCACAGARPRRDTPGKSRGTGIRPRGSGSAHPRSTGSEGDRTAQQPRFGH